MLFGREVDNPPGSGERPILRNEHLAYFDVLTFAGILVGAEIRGERLFEHQSDPLAHHADRIYGVYQRFGRGFEKITLCDFVVKKCYSL